MMDRVNSFILGFTWLGGDFGSLLYMSDTDHDELTIIGWFLIVLYHKVACLVHILQTSLSQVDHTMLKELNVGLSNGLDHNHNHRNIVSKHEGK